MSEQKYRGVGPYRGKWRASYTRSGLYGTTEEKYLGPFESAIEAALALDEREVQKKGILTAYDRLRVKSPERTAEYEHALSKLQDERRKGAEAREAEIQARRLDPKDYQAVLEKWRLGIDLRSLSSTHAVSEAEIASVIRLQEEQRLAAIGLTVVPVETASQDVVTAQMRGALSNGTSLRGLERKFGFDRRSIARMLGIGKGEALDAGAERPTQAQESDEDQESA
jgi:hypothetical protein